MIRFNIKHLAFQAIFFFLLLQQVLLNYSSGVINTAFSYTDEALTCVFVIVILFRYNRFGKVLCRQERIMLVFFCVFIAFAGISNILYPLQSVFLNVSDLIVCSRFIIIYLAIRILFPDRNKSAKLLLSLSGPCKVLISITFIFLVHDVFFTPIFPKSDYRYFMNSLQLFYGLPTNMSSACATCAFVLIAAMSVSKKEKDHNPLFIAMALLSVALTLRSKAIGGMACVLFIYVVYVKYRFRSIFFGFLLGGVIVLAIGWEQLDYYFGPGKAEAGYSRALLLSDSIRLATQRFPFGTGFATFGSNIAATHYSPLYTDLGYAGISNMTPDNPSFLSDTFWSIVIAQSGWIGATAFLAVVGCLLYLAFQLRSQNLYLFWAASSVIIFQLINSVAEPAFFHPMAASMIFLFALIINIPVRRHEHCFDKKPIDIRLNTQKNNVL